MLNYKHLHYFWAVVHSGSIARASEQLHLTPQTLSGQIKLLEERMGRPLLRKAGRGLEPTAAGRMALKFANDIFALGAELEDALHSGRDAERAGVFRVGVAHAVPKSIAYHLIEPGLRSEPSPRLVCSEGKLADLLAQLASHRIDLVISDVPLPPNMSIKAYSHLLGRCGTGFFATSALLEKNCTSVARAQALFPACLQTLPLLLPAMDSVLRQRLDAWLLAQGLSPVIAGEFDDSVLMKFFGRAGRGVFTAPSALSHEICQQYDVVPLGVALALPEAFYALSVERRIKHTAVAAITSAARSELFNVHEAVR